MNPIRSMPRVGLLLLAGSLASAGCGVSPPQPADAAQAREALRATLESWQNGDQPAALSQHKPPIAAVDYEWSAGRRLLRYEIGTETAVGGSLRCQVRLTIQDPSGRSVQKSATYSVDTSPVLTVHREDDL